MLQLFKTKGFLVVRLLIIFLFTIFLNSSTLKIIKNFQPTNKDIKDGAIILDKNTSINIEKNGSILQKTKYLIAILNKEAARDYTQIKIRFNSYFLDTNISYARVIDKNGTFINIKKDAIKYKDYKKINSYDDTKEIIFSLPNLKEKKFIEYEIVSKTKKNIIKNNTSSLIFPYKWQVNETLTKARVDRIKQYNLIIKDKTNRLYFKTFKFNKPIIIKNKNSTTYKWKLFNLPKIEVQKNPNIDYINILPSLSYSTIKSWQDINDLFYKQYNSAIIVDKNIKNLALTLTKDVDTKEEKIKKIYSYIQSNIKYIFAYLGRSGYFPHKSTEVLKNLYGDCKDQATLFIAMLKAINIKAEFAFVNSLTNFLEKYKLIVSPKYFNHVVVYIPSLNIFIDTTGFNNKFPGILWMLNKKDSFIITNNKPIFKKIKAKDSELIKVNVKIVNEPQNSVIQGEINIALDDYISAIYKLSYANIQNYKNIVEATFLRIYNNIEITKFNLLNINNPLKNVRIEFKFNFNLNGKQKKQFYNSILLNLYSIFGPYLYLPTPNSIKYGFRLNYKLTINLKTKIKILDKDYKIIFEKIPPNFNTKYFNYLFSFDKNSTNEISVFENLTLKKHKFNNREYKEFFNENKALNYKVSWLLLAFKEDKPKNNKNIALIEQLIQKGSFQEAKKLLEERLKKEPKNAKLHYLYGVALGFLDQFELSQKEFDIANKLGYEE